MNRTMSETNLKIDLELIKVLSLRIYKKINR